MTIEDSFDSVSSSTNARELKHVIENLLSCDPKVKKDGRYVKLYEIVTTKDEIDALVLLSKEELRCLHFQSDGFISPRLSKLEIAGIQSLQLNIKSLQEKGVY